MVTLKRTLITKGSLCSLLWCLELSSMVTCLEQCKSSWWSQVQESQGLSLKRWWTSGLFSWVVVGRTIQFNLLSTKELELTLLLSLNGIRCQWWIMRCF